VKTISLYFDGSILRAARASDGQYLVKDNNYSVGLWSGEHVKAAVPPSPLEMPPVSSFKPYLNGRYEVSMGIYSIGTDFGNGEADKRIFQIDRDFYRYQEAKRESARSQIGHIHLRGGLGNDAEASATSYFVHTLSREYPDYFSLRRMRHGYLEFRSYLDGYVLTLNRRMQLLGVYNQYDPGTYDRDMSLNLTSLDCLGFMIQADFAIVEFNKNRDWVSYMHVSMPSGWRPKDKIMKSFSDVHKPVPGMGKLRKQGFQISQTICRKGPFVRFVWGPTSDLDLDHHPDRFSPKGWGNIYLRVERQVTVPFPDCNACLFLIHVYPVDVDWGVDTETSAAIISAIEGMTGEELRYKGLDGWEDRIVGYIERKCKKRI